MSNLVNGVVELTQQLVRLPSYTPINPDDYPACQATLDILEAVAIQAGAATWRLPAEGNSPRYPYRVDNLYIELVRGTPRKHLCFLGHTDIVGLGDQNAWTMPALQGDIHHGYIYGRGTTDMKGAVAAFFAALKALPGMLTDIGISAIITTDEEWAAVNGTRHVLDWLHKTGRHVDAFLVGEPSSRDVLGSHIKLGRRGSLVGQLIATGIQGHAAYPADFVNANRALTLTLALLQTLTWEDGDDIMPATAFQPVALQGGDFNASAIIPGVAKAKWNIRFTPAQSPRDLVQCLTDMMTNKELWPHWIKHHPDAALLNHVHVEANLDSVSMPYVSEAGLLTAAAQTAISKICGKLPAIDSSGGTTDGRFARLAFPGAEIVEVGPPERGGLTENGEPPVDYQTHGGMHQVNERIAIGDVENLTKIYGAIITNFVTSAS